MDGMDGLGAKSEAMTTTRCQFPTEKAMVPWFGPFIGIEIAVCGPIDLIRSGFGHHMPAMDGTGSQF